MQPPQMLQQSRTGSRAARPSGNKPITDWRLAATNKKHADCKRVEAPVFQPGDRAWLTTKNLQGLSGCRKLTAKYTNPFKVIKQIMLVMYRLELPRQLGSYSWVP